MTAASVCRAPQHPAISQLKQNTPLPALPTRLQRADLLTLNYITTAALCQHLHAPRKEALSPHACLLVGLYVRPAG